jgi:nucleoid-associated protein YgaU
MSLRVQTIPSVDPAPQTVPPATVHARAADTGNPRSSEALAVTVPIITTDQTQLRYEQRRAGGGIDFRFETGTLTLRLRQEIYVSSELSACARGIWTEHERLHVRDNRQVLAHMDREIRADGTLRAILIDRQWLPRDSFDLIQQTIQESVARIFGRLTREAAARRDTRQEYARVQRSILNRCPEPLQHTVERGENLSQLASFFYGDSSRWRIIYDANRQTIGRNPNVIRPGQRLHIPRAR